MRACFGGVDDMVEILLARGADVHVVDAAGKTALHYAVKQNTSIMSSPGVVRMLLGAGADIEAQMHDGATPLAYGLMQADSYKGRHNDAWEVLLDRGANIHAQVWGMWEDGRDTNKRMSIFEAIKKYVSGPQDVDGYSFGVFRYIQSIETKALLLQSTHTMSAHSADKRPPKI